jgi:hypothetical protein
MNFTGLGLVGFGSDFQGLEPSLGSDIPYKVGQAVLFRVGYPGKYIPGIIIELVQHSSKRPSRFRVLRVRTVTRDGLVDHVVTYDSVRGLPHLQQIEVERVIRDAEVVKEARDIKSKVRARRVKMVVSEKVEEVVPKETVLGSRRVVFKRKES